MMKNLPDAASLAPQAAAAANPLLQPWHGSHGLPPFAELRPEHFPPAFEQAFAQHRAEIDAIAQASAAPSFDNTVAALDRCGRLLSRTELLFDNLTSCETSPALQTIERDLAPRQAAHRSAVYMNAALFARLDALQREREALGLTPEQDRLLQRYHLDFVRAGARLPPAAQARYAAIMQRLAELTTQFAQNVLADEAAFGLVLRGEADLAGLPPALRASARQAALDRGLGDDAAGEAHVISLSRSHITAFLSFSQRRDLREQAWLAWTSRGEHTGAHDNRPVAREILSLRREQAALHGHANYADYALVDTMAGRHAAVQALLEQVWAPAKARVETEREALTALQRERGEHFALEAWDWRFYAELLRRVRYDVDEAVVKPYFSLERMVEAAFDCAGRLFGLHFAELPGVPLYHADVKAYEVRGPGDTLVGIFLHDNFARASKRSGAWMSAYREQSRLADGTRVVPVIANHNNFIKGAPGQPTLLSLDDVRTLFHEFGHGLHGLLSDVGYERLSGTNVLRDFVELPSQLFEHWATEPEVLQRHARHHVTGEPIPHALVKKLKAAERFNQGYETVRYTASALVDLAIHALPDAQAPDIVAFEAAELQRLGMPAGVGLNHRLPHFQHLFSGASYAAGYYVYLWAEVLDADAFDAFVEAGDPFDAATARRLQTCVYGCGASLEPARAFEAFRGRPPVVEPMLRERGLLAEPAG